MAKTIIGGVVEAQRLARLGSDLSRTALENMKPGDVLTDGRNPGFRARRQGTGAPVLEFRYRHGGKRKTVKLGAYRRHPDDGRTPHTVLEALERYHLARDVLDRGQDPALVKVTERARTLGPALDAYEASLAERQVVKRREYLSLLRRELLKPLGDIPLDDITRPVLVKRFEEIAPKRPGTAKELRTRAGVFLGWCASKGLLATNPLEGYRAERKTRAQRNGDQEHGRALADWELPILWRAASEAKVPLGAYLLVRLLCGQRREETARMRWRDLDLDAGIWRIPPEVGKTRGHDVPLPRLVRVILRALPHNGPLVFAGRDGKLMSGWSKRLAPVYAATKEAGMPKWMPGDLRKTMRSGLTALGVPFEVRELMIAHSLPGDLERRYDRAVLWGMRQQAARRWALHVLGVVNRAKRERKAVASPEAA